MAIDPRTFLEATAAGAGLSIRAPATAHVPCSLRGHQAPASDLHRLAETGWFEGLGFPLGQRLEDTFRSPVDVGSGSLRP